MPSRSAVPPERQRVQLRVPVPAGLEPQGQVRGSLGGSSGRSVAVGEAVVGPVGLDHGLDLGGGRRRRGHARRLRPIVGEELPPRLAHRRRIVDELLVHLLHEPRVRPEPRPLTIWCCHARQRTGAPPARPGPTHAVDAVEARATCSVADVRPPLATAAVLLLVLTACSSSDDTSPVAGVPDAGTQAALPQGALQAVSVIGNGRAVQAASANGTSTLIATTIGLNAGRRRGRHDRRRGRHRPAGVTVDRVPGRAPRDRRRIRAERVVVGRSHPDTDRRRSRHRPVGCSPPTARHWSRRRRSRSPRRR